MGKKAIQAPNWKQQLSLSPKETVTREFVQEIIEQAAAEIHQRVARQLLAAQGELLSSIGAAKEVLLSKGVVSESEYEQARFSVEDRAWGLTLKQTAAQVGDFVRTSFRSKGPSDSEFGSETRQNVPHLGDANLKEEVSSAIVGMTAGETKDVTVGDHTLRILVSRVSSYPQKQEEKA